MRFQLFHCLFNPDDGLNTRAVALAETIKARNIALVVSNFVFAEVVTVLAQRYALQAAIQAGNYFLRDPFVTIIYADSVLQTASWQIFLGVRNKNISFVDCSIVAAMKAEGIAKLITFDKKDFKILQKYHRFSIVENS